MMSEEAINRLTERIIGAAFAVGNTLGAGFLEKVYENALAHELRKVGLHVEQQRPLRVHYDNVVVGDYVADLIAENCVLIELKAAKGLEDIHFAQCMNYLKATKMKICLLINFGSNKVQIKRIVHDF